MVSPEPSAPLKPLLRVDSIESGYGRVKVLHGVSLEVHKGEVVGIIGPNGAGKSTMLRTLSGLCRPSGGTILFAGEKLAGLRPHAVARRGLGHCPEGRRVFQHLSVDENLETGFLSGRGRSEAAAKEEVFGLFPVLAERRSQRASRLSGGQQQMLAIGRALMGKPDLLLLDEPSLGLAPLVINQIFENIIRLAESGVSILLVEQNVDLSFEIADYIYAFEQGRVHCSGPTEKLKGDQRIREMYLPSAV